MSYLIYGKRCDTCGKFLADGTEENKKCFNLWFEEYGADVGFIKHFCSIECLKKWAGEYR
jgi:hypothetical protein